MTTRRGPPPPEYKLDWHEVLETAITAPGSVGNVYNRFYEYSFMNQMLLMMQGVLEPVATYKKWGTLGRQVLKGSKAKVIVRPIVIPKRDEHGEKTDQSYLRFKPVRCLFGLSETEGAELPPAPDPPDWNLATAHDALDVREVPFTHLNGNVQGFSTGREYAVSPIAVFPAKTRFHEIGHIVSGHTEPGEMAEYLTHRGLKEFEAEGSAHLVMNELELMTPDQAAVSRGYLQHWMQGERPPEPSIRTVFKTTDLILKAGRLAVVQEEVA